MKFKTILYILNLYRICKIIKKNILNNNYGYFIYLQTLCNNSYSSSPSTVSTSYNSYNSCFSI